MTRSWQLLFAVAVLATLAACGGRRSRAAATPTLSPQAAYIEIVTMAPDRTQFQYLGEVQGTAKARDMAEATRLARIDLRNRAAAMGGTIVTLDTSTAGNALDWSGRNQVVLVGRVFRPLHPPPQAAAPAGAGPSAASTGDTASEGELPPVPPPPGATQ